MSKPKQVIWITTDHMREDLIGAYGHPDIETPNLDRLANQGVNFRQCYVQSPLCQPSRASFMTSLYPQQVGVTRLGVEFPDDCDLKVADVFKKADYKTIQVGKLHFQCHEDHDLRPDEEKTYGFDYFLLSEGRGAYEDAYMKWLRLKYPHAVEAQTVPRPNSPERNQLEIGGSPTHPIDVGIETTHCAFVVDRAIAQLKRHDGQFVHMGFHHPHPPLNPTREVYERYATKELQPAHEHPGEDADKPESLKWQLHSRDHWDDAGLDAYRRGFYAMITEFDICIGTLLDWLEENDQLDETLIVFNSDHGDMNGDHRMTHKSTHFYDEVMRVPWIMYWPNGLGTDRRDIDGLVEMVDVMPTMLGLCDQPISPRMQGIDYSAALLNGEAIEGREDVYAIHEPGLMMLRNKQYKYIRFSSEKPEVLYDLVKDPKEVVNCAEDEAYAQVMHTMRERALQRTLDASHTRYEANYRF